MVRVNAVYKENAENHLHDNCNTVPNDIADEERSCVDGIVVKCAWLFTIEVGHFVCFSKNERSF